MLLNLNPAYYTQMYMYMYIKLQATCVCISKHNTIIIIIIVSSIPCTRLQQPMTAPLPPSRQPQNKHTCAGVPQDHQATEAINLYSLS